MMKRERKARKHLVTLAMLLLPALVGCEPKDPQVEQALEPYKQQLVAQLAP